MKNPGNIQLIILLMALFVFGCNKNDKVEPGDQPGKPGNIPGMGDAKGELQGTPFVFPTDIGITDGILGDINFGDYCQQGGSGEFVLLQFNFINNSGKDTVLVFPAGLTFRSLNDHDQNGLLIQETDIRLEKDATCKTMLYAYCINENRDPSSYDSRYEFGPVTNAKPITELVGLVHDKKVNYDPNDEDAMNLARDFVQYAVWDITEGAGLTDEDKADLATITDK